MNGRTFYHEEQRFRQPWIWILLIGITLLETAVFGAGLVEQLVFKRPWGNHPTSDAALILSSAFAILIPGALLVLMAQARLITEAREDGIYFRFVPFHLSFHSLPWSRIQRVEAVTYNPLMEYGGWGIRYSLKGKAYNVSGNRGLKVYLDSGKPILFGSQSPEAFAKAVHEARGLPVAP